MVDVNVYECLVESLRQKGCTDTQIIEEISTLFDAIGFYTTSSDTSTLDDKTKVIYILDQLCIPKHFLGYNYMVQSILEYKKEPCRYLKKDVYPKVAAKYNVSVITVDSGIKRAIEVGCKKCKISTMVKIFGENISENLGNPTNVQAIKIIAEKIDYFDFSELKPKNSFEIFIEQYREEGYSDKHILVELRNYYREFLQIRNHELSCENETEKLQRKYLDKILNELDIPKNLVGYNYLVETVILYKKNINHNFNDLYKKVGDIYGTSYIRVESAIKRVLEEANHKSLPSRFKKIFGCVYTPDNYQAITMLAKAIG